MNLLKNKDVYLRAVEPEDAHVMLKWENDPKYWHLSNTQIPFSLKTMQDYANSVHDIYNQKQYRFIICLI